MNGGDRPSWRSEGGFFGIFLGGGRMVAVVFAAAIRRALASPGKKGKLTCAEDDHIEFPTRDIVLA